MVVLSDESQSESVGSASELSLQARPAEDSVEEFFWAGMLRECGNHVVLTSYD